MIFSRILRPLATATLALVFAASVATAQQRGEAAVPVGTGSTRQAPAPVLTGSGPNGATLRCRDGSYPAPMATDDACASKGGVLARFPLRPTPQPAAAPTRPTRSSLRAAPDSARRAPDDFVPWRERRAAAAAEEARRRPPAGATLRCGDGSWVVGDTTSARCATKGGVTLRIAQPRPRGRD
jgi:hypothetical protein